MNDDNTYVDAQWLRDWIRDMCAEVRNHEENLPRVSRLMDVIAVKDKYIAELEQKLRDVRQGVDELYREYGSVLDTGDVMAILDRHGITEEA